MPRHVSIVSGGVSYEEMVEYVSQQMVASGILPSIQGIGDIIVTTESGITMVDGTELIAEDGDLVDGGTLV